MRKICSVEKVSLTLFVSSARRNYQLHDAVYVCSPSAICSGSAGGRGSRCSCRRLPRVESLPKCSCTGGFAARHTAPMRVSEGVRIHEARKLPPLVMVTVTPFSLVISTLLYLLHRTRVCLSLHLQPSTTHTHLFILLLEEGDIDLLRSLQFDEDHKKQRLAQGKKKTNKQFGTKPQKQRKRKIEIEGFSQGTLFQINTTIIGQRGSSLEANPPTMDNYTPIYFQINICICKKYIENIFNYLKNVLINI